MPNLVRLAVAVFQALPAPAGGDAQHGLGQGAQVIGHLLDRQAALHVARQGAKHLSVVRPAQQVQQGFVVVFAAALQRGAPALQLVLEFGRR
jgi:hypothetical protein